MISHTLHTIILDRFKGTQMGPLLVYCFPLFQGKCKCHMQNCVFFVYFLLKCNRFSFGNKISKWHKLEKKKLFLTYSLSQFLVTKGRHKNSFSTYPTYIYTYIWSPYWLLCLPNFAIIANVSCMASLWYYSRYCFVFAPFWRNE